MPTMCGMYIYAVCAHLGSGGAFNISVFVWLCAMCAAGTNVSGKPVCDGYSIYDVSSACPHR